MGKMCLKQILKPVVTATITLEQQVALAMLVVTGTLLSASHAIETPEFTREQEFRTRDGAFVVRSDSGSKFIVSVSNRTLAIRSTDSSIEPCSSPIDPFEDAIQGEMRARYFESLEKMFIWGVRGSENILASKDKTVYYTMLLVDPKNCQSAAVWLPDERVASSRALFLPEVLPPYPFSSDFDVYFALQHHCSPCSFDGSGRRLSKDRGPLEAEEAEPAGPVHLLWLNPVEDSSVGYFYAFNFANRTAVVKLLDERHRVRRFRYLENPVDVVSVKSGRIRNVGYCYQVHDSPAQLHCERLDSRLQAIVSVTVPLDQSARRVSLEYDTRGNFFVGVVLPSAVRVFVYDIVGALLATLDFGQLQDSLSVRDLAAYFQDNQYCLFYSIEQQNSRVNDANNIVKCMDTRKYINDPV